MFDNHLLVIHDDFHVPDSVPGYRRMVNDVADSHPHSLAGCFESQYNNHHRDDDNDDDDNHHHTDEKNDNFLNHNYHKKENDVVAVENLPPNICPRSPPCVPFLLDNHDRNDLPHHIHNTETFFLLWALRDHDYIDNYHHAYIFLH
eukprot:CAMPEP_0197308536 /NCGR_PEP_ID=MMETSP0891-20130614/6939_1 /TAXON_ID=44058 ORGANISM="Aureoumbra lagunensis, Strain CCMP1510" /NCGR_SAMPLE_ID=MMETSP0891 /ASSEMBLY_ACC=CAM_ASM_000534 /LENGTH=145 /DNA_ID=CAMNT_0042792993 /DNA_START=433 /DNA_END=870 /DNA_ORIENTATION=+